MFAYWMHFSNYFYYSVSPNENFFILHNFPLLPGENPNSLVCHSKSYTAGVRVIVLTGSSALSTYLQSIFPSRLAQILSRIKILASILA